MRWDRDQKRLLECEDYLNKKWKYNKEYRQIQCEALQDM